MGKAMMCDVCNKPISAKQSLTHGLYEQYKVKIKYIEEGWSFAGSFRNTKNLDVCPSCMNKFVDFVRTDSKEE